MWQKSSFSGDAGCVEVWKKSSFSGSGGTCIEVAEADDGWLMRDSKDPDGPRLRFNRAEVKAFVDGVKAGEFD
jgi:hypothetical protein